MKSPKSYSLCLLSVLLAAICPGCAAGVPPWPESSANGVVDASEGSGTTEGDVPEGDETTSSGIVDADTSTSGALDEVTTTTTGDDGNGPEGVESGSTSDAEGSETTGGDLPWFAGHYAGTWSGVCDALGTEAFGTWSVGVDASGNLDGSYSGSVSGSITGSVDPQGTQLGTAQGLALGECDWAGVIEVTGDAEGSIVCGACSGEWSGSLQK